MATRRRLRFIYLQFAVMLGALFGLAVLDALSYELVFVVSLIGLLASVELTAPLNVRPRWRERLKYVLAVALAVFGYILIRRALDILGFWVM